MLTEEQKQVVKELCDSTGESFLYIVMFDHPSQGKVFGKVDQYNDDAYAQAKKGRLIVEHVVFPASRGPYAVKAEKLTPLKTRFEGRPSQNTLAGKLGFFQWGNCPKEDYCALEGLVHEIRAERNKDDGVQVNDMFSIGVADGSAEYVVTAVNGNRCTVEWRGFWNADAYTDHHFGWGRKSSLADVARYVDMKRGMAKIFGQQKGKPVDKPKAFKTLMGQYRKHHGFDAPVEL